MSELEIPVDASLFREIATGSAEAEILVDLIRAAVSVTFVLTSDDDA